MAKQYTITILTDKTSWMNTFNCYLSEKLHSQGHSVYVFDSKENLQGGDILFLLSCFQRIEEKYLSLYKHVIVIHASSLPEGKGWSPASWQILEGKNNIPITLFEANTEIDAGDIYLQDILILDGSELLDEWQEKLGKKIIEMAMEFVVSLHTIQKKPQHGESTFYKRRRPQDSELDPHKTLAEQFNLLRIVDNTNYPAFFTLYGERYIVTITKEKNK